MPLIRADPDRMRQEAQQIVLAAEALASIRQQVLSVSLSAPSYEGQFGPNVLAVMAELVAAIDKLMGRITSCAEYVGVKAEAFDEADHLAMEGWDGAAEQYRTWLDAEHIPFDLIARLRDGRAPEGIPEEVWRHLSPEDKAALLLGQVEELEKSMDAYLEPPWAEDERWLWEFLGLDERLDRPGNFPPEEWAAVLHYVEGKRREFEDMWPHFVAAVLAGTSYLPPADPRKYFREMFDAYVNGVSEEGKVADTSVLESAFGKGRSVWNDYRPRERAPAQYMDVGLIAGFGAAEHFNLCGQLAVMAAVGESDLANGLQRFAEATTWQGDYDLQGKLIQEYHNGADILANAREGTTLSTLNSFFEQYGYESRISTGELDPTEMGNMLRDGKAIVALVNMDTGLDGRLMGLDSSQSDTPHFVTVLQVAQSHNGDAFVRVYNPFQNREELYPWDTFRGAWAETSGNSTQYGLVVADAP